MSDHLSDDLLSALIDGELSLTAREAAVQHLRGCPHCAERQDRLIVVVASLRQIEPAGWVDADTRRVISQLERPQRARSAGAVGIAAVFALMIVLLQPLVALPFTAFSLCERVLGGVVPPVVPSGFPSLLVPVLAVAVLAPLAAYPLARWR
jgi:anti-sigma factor RsiW